MYSEVVERNDDELYGNKLIRERMPSIDEVDNGKILMHGTHSIDNVTRVGTYLVLFNDSILIDDQNFTNDQNMVLEYLRNTKFWT